MRHPTLTGVRVRTPATSANLGPGFDALGIALGLYDDIDIEPRHDGEVTVDVEGEGAGELPRDSAHLVAHALRHVFEVAGCRPPGLALTCRNHIPHGRGLGSSAAAIVAGVSAATVLLGEADPATGEIDRDRVFRLAADVEGHPDNVAPCVYGGFTVAWRDGVAWQALAMEPSPRVRPVVCVPGERLATQRARGLLPGTVPHPDAVFTAGRAALLVAAVTGHPELLLDATADRLHESYREPAMPTSARLLRELRESAGLPAVISGAGPSLLVLCDSATGAEEAGAARGGGQIVDDLVDSIQERAGTGWHVRPLQTDPAGVWISSPRSSTCGEE